MKTNETRNRNAPRNQRYYATLQFANGTGADCKSGNLKQLLRRIDTNFAGEETDWGSKGVSPIMAFEVRDNWATAPGREIVASNSGTSTLRVSGRRFWYSRHFVLLAEIRTDSKYYRDQGLSANGKPERYPLDSIDTRRQDGYVFRFAGNIYRREDCILFAQVDGRDVRLT